MYPDDTTRLRHMLDAAKDAIKFTEGKRRGDLNADRQLVLALVKSIEIVGEAAAKITPAATDRHDEIPWAAIVGMRNRLIHGYYEIDLDRVWDTVLHNLPPLVAALEAILATR